MDWWTKVSKDVVPYLNVATASSRDTPVEDAPDQGFLQKMGGRGFPYCVLMNAEGEVLWEQRPTSEDAFKAGLADAKLLAELKAKAAKSPDDQALAASIKLFDALGRSQRPMPEMDELKTLAATEGIDAGVAKRFGVWFKEKGEETALMAAMRARDGGKKALEMFKSGTKPDVSNRLATSFYRMALLGAIQDGDKDVATQALEAVEKTIEASPQLKNNPRVKADVEKWREQVNALEK